MKNPNEEPFDEESLEHSYSIFAPDYQIYDEWDGYAEDSYILDDQEEYDD